MRVLHLCSYYGDRFYERMFEEQINHFDLSVFYPKKDNSEFDRNSDFLITKEVIKKYHKYFFSLKTKAYFKSLVTTYRNFEFDCIHAHTLFTDGAIALTVKEKYNIPYIVSVRNTDLNFFFKYRFLQWRLGIKVLDEATKIVCLSPSYKEKLIEIYFRKNGKNKKFSEKIEIIPNGMDNFYLKNSYKDKKLLQNKIRILTVGDISKRKNQLTVCKALANSNLDIEYTIVGKVKDEKYFSEIKKFKFVNYIDFIEKNELIQLYRKNDVFVLPSLSETFGIVYAEAMSQNLPVIYSKGEGFDNQFDSGVVGYEVNAKSSNDVLLGIEKIIKHRDAFNKNYKYARKFSWEKIVKKQEKLYMEIIRG